ncbi:MAG TPA: MBL fold metallo-hydrolase [Pseudonocardiaceae bacterium]|nr:MBL fold metallo-hydrolase [Pseudonocardiaceae bacterium]
MLLTVLGCAGSVPGPNAAASGYLIETGDRSGIAVDLGNGTLAALQAVRDPFTLDALLFSHLHPDHCADFSALTVLRKYHPAPPVDPRTHRLPVHAPSDAPTRFAAAYAPNATEAAETDLTDVYTFHPFDTEPAEIGGYRVTAARVAHPCEAYGLRIEHEGHTLCYTGDSGPCDALVTLADGVHTLLAEASWTHSPDRPPDMHLSGRQAGELATKAGVGRLVVTHVLPWADASAVLAEACAAFAGEVVLAEAGAAYQV